MTHRRSSSLLPLVVLGHALACGGSETPPPAKTPPPPAEPVVVPPPAGGSTGGPAGGGTTMVDPFGTGDDWAADTEVEATVGEPTADTDGDDTDGEPDKPPVYAGPCYVRWGKGPVLRFRYADDGDSGWLRIDGDNDGTNEVCARFWTKDGRTNKVTVDQGCDNSTDAIISPTYEEGVNLAKATYTDKSSGTDVEHELTLITLPAFTGIAPGYPLYAAKDDVELTVDKGKVTKATLKKPFDGPAIKLTLKYDDEGRVTRIDEDQKADGSLDRRYSYRYDEVGNVTGITLDETDRSGDKPVKTKKTAKLGYSCWATPAAATAADPK